MNLFDDDIPIGLPNRHPADRDIATRRRVQPGRAQFKPHPLIRPGQA